MQFLHINLKNVQKENETHLIFYLLPQENPVQLTRRLIDQGEVRFNVCEFLCKEENGGGGTSSVLQILKQ